MMVLYIVILLWIMSHDGVVILLWIRSHDGVVYCYIVMDKVP